MTPYPAYTASGIEWLGEIPAHWEVNKLKHFSQIVNGSTPQTGNNEYWDEGEIVWLTPNDLGKLDGKRINDSSRKITEKGLNSCGTSLTPPNSIVLSTRAPIGHIAITNVSSCTNQGCRTIVPELTLCDVTYIYYLLYSQKEELQSLGQGSTFTELSGQNLGNFRIPFPSLLEQRAIANYLDHKTRLIDTYLAQKQQQIERWQAYRTALINQAVTKGLNPAAPMKDSGIEWLGDIPAHWEVKRIKTISDVISKGTTPSTIGGDISDRGNIRFIKAENISNNRLSRLPEFFIDEKTNELLKRSQLQENDILFVIAGATLGKVAILRKDYLPANTNQAVCFIRLNQKGHVKFMWYWLQSNMIIGLTWLDAVQSAQPNLSMGRLGNFNIPYPSLDEQCVIAAYLDEQIAKIDTLIAATQQQLDRLHAYRTALISDAVTGKMDVRNDRDCA